MSDNYLAVFLISVLLALILLIRLFRKTTLRWSITPLDPIMALLTIYTLVSIAVVSKFPVQHISYRETICGFSIYLLGSHLFRDTKNSLFLFAHIVATITTLLCINSLLKVSHIIASQSQAFAIAYPFENPGILAAFMACSLPFGIYRD